MNLEPLIYKEQWIGKLQANFTESACISARTYKSNVHGLNTNGFKQSKASNHDKFLECTSDQKLSAGYNKTIKSHEMLIIPRKA